MSEPGSAPTLDLATLNFEHGGKAPNGEIHLQPAVDHLAEQLPNLDILFYQEANDYARDGHRPLYEMNELLRKRFGGTWHAHLAFSNAVFVRLGSARVAEAWHEAEDRFGRSQHARPLRLHVDGLDMPLIVQSVHWRYNSGRTRAEEASQFGNLIAHPSIIAGDFNSLWPDERELVPDWGKLSPHVRYHKAKYNSATKRWETDLEAGWITSDQGWVDAGALAGRFEVTTNNPPDRATCRIDRIMVSPPLAKGLDTNSYTVHVPEPGGQVSDHRLVSVRLDLSRYGEPFDAPWWNTPRVNATYVGGDDSGNPNAYRGWQPR